jgi:hypothetical protein
MSTIVKAANGYTLPNGLDVASIAPHLGEKYSPNLHEFLLKHPSQARMARVFLDGEGTAYIGFIDDTDQLIGARLSQVLSMGRKTTLGSYYMPRDWTEHASFWAEYIADGRCAIDREHVVPYIGSDTRWRTTGDCRQCLWCNQVTQKLRRWTETKVVEREAWETASALGVTAEA